MRIWRTLAVVPAALTLTLAAPATAATVPAPVLNITTQRAQVLSLDSVTLNGTTATLSFTYSCVGSPFALWVSLKQPLTGVETGGQEFGSGSSRAWDSLHSSVPCTKSPKPQQATITVEDEYQQMEDEFQFANEPLASGLTFVQLCLTSSPAAAAAFGDDPEPRSSAGKAEKLALHYTWLTI
jgi:hypothetical protein